MLKIWFVLIPAIYLLSVFHVSEARHLPSDTLQYELEEIEIRATRDTETAASAPFSIAVKSRSVYEQDFEPAISFDRVASGLPGLWVNDRQNYALGERVSIRGMGWRTAFGVRGIFVMMDDIPLTVPDGQTVMDVLDPAMVRQMEVIRGPSSSFWGNASGGTLFLSTRPASYEPALRARFYTGAFDTYNTQLSGTYQEGPRRYHLNMSYLSRDGYRDHSRHESYRLTGHMGWDLGRNTDILVSGAFVEAPDTRHPGSLSQQDLDEDRRQAATMFELASAGKSWRQGQLGLTLQSDTDMGRWRGTVYGISRSLHNPLPFADIEVDRLSAGSRVSLINDDNFFSWGVGFDAAIQSDDRRNYDYMEFETNDNTFQTFRRGAKVIDQQETVVNSALFARAGTGWERFNLSGGIRMDLIRFETDDRLVTGGEDQSGDRAFTALSPHIGASLQIRSALAYANFGTSFETPTTTELVNRPDMTGGFNPEIDPERAIGFELGFRGAWSDYHLRYDLALFRMNVRDQLVSYRTEEGGQRDFYRNAGSTRHDGAEVALQWRPQSWLEWSVNYHWSDFTFHESVDTDQVTFTSGNRLPGIPEHRFFSEITVMPASYRLSLSVEKLDSYYVDNANTSENPGYEVFHLRLGHNGFGIADQLILRPFLKVENLTDVAYNSSVSINAFGGRYYEPAPGRALYGGISLEL